MPRGFRIEEPDGRTVVVPDVPTIPAGTDSIHPDSGCDRRITLRWSHEALAAAAYGVSFWYMERVGEVVFKEAQANPWPEMSPADAGANAAESGLYYAILRARDERERSRAVALYNTYGFGYAIGMNYRCGRRREMLWPEDLREIAAHGRTKQGCRIVRSRLEMPADLGSIQGDSLRV